MSYNIHIYLRSADFSQEFADENNNGEESPENIRHEWEDEFRIVGAISDVEVVRDQVFPLNAEQGEGTPISFDIPEMIVFQFKMEEGITPIAISEAALEEYILDTEKKSLTVYLNDLEVIENPIPGIYIVLSQFPEVLR